ncbi:uncharacterized protein LOC135501493 isoform X2 [Lineus longissimus]|uniref:uncharacterized protein LOC135501493 isoform X2 n=1 Tax=Lineus longissimus TaxID=88925 RepID=UPI002B4D167F
MMEKDPDQPSNGSNGEPEASMATDIADEAKTKRKSAFSPSRPTAVVNRLKTLLANMKRTHTEKAEGESVSIETGRVSPSSPSNDPIPVEPDVSDRPKVPLKQRSFLNPFLELTAAAQGTTEEEVMRSSPDLFENVTVKQEKQDSSGQCSRSCGHSGLSDESSDALTSKVPAADCLKGQWSGEMQESVAPSAEKSLEKAKTMADSESQVIDHNTSADQGESNSSSKEKEVELGNFLSSVVDGVDGDDRDYKQVPAEPEVTTSSAQSVSCEDALDAIASKPIASLLDGRNDSENAEKTFSAIPEIDLPNTIVADSPTNLVTAAVNETNAILSNEKSGNEITCGSLIEPSGMDIANKQMDVAMPNLEQDQNKENDKGTCGIADERMNRYGTDFTMPSQQDKQVEGEISGRADIRKDRIAALPNQEQDKLEEGGLGGTAMGGIDGLPVKDSLKHLKEKFPLLWEAAGGGEANENIGSELNSEDTAPLGMVMSKSQTSIETKENCRLVALDKSHDDVNLKENAIAFDDAVSDGTVENQANTRLEEPEDTLVPEDGHGESDCSNGKISKVSISDDSDVMAVDDDISRPPSTAGSGRSTGTGGNLVVEQGSSNLVEFNNTHLESGDSKLLAGDDIGLSTTLKSHSASDLKGSGDSLSVANVPFPRLETEKTSESTGTVEQMHVIGALDSKESEGVILKNTCSNNRHSENLMDSSDFLSIKIADVKSMNVEEFEKVESPAGVIAGRRSSSIEADQRNQGPSPTPSDGSVITVLGASGPSDNIKTNDVIVKCKYKNGKYHCLMCKFSITFSTSFAVHLHKHLHKLNQICTVCCPTGSSPKSLNDSPFKITCPVIKSTMDALERARQKKSSQYLSPKLSDSSFAAASPLSLSGFTPTENILEPNYPGSDLTVIKSGESAAHVSLVRGSMESEEDCVVISGTAVGLEVEEPGSAEQVMVPDMPSVVVDLAPSEVSNKTVSIEAIGAPSKPIIDMSDIPTALPMSQFQRSMSTSSAAGSGNKVTAHQLTEETIILSIVKLENSKGFYTCGFPRCNFSSSIESNLGTHSVVSHSFERSFPCVYCGHKFDEGDSLLVHMKGHHNASKMFQLYRCCFGKCKFCSNNSQAFKQHINIMHAMETQFTCIFCKEDMSGDDELIRHLNENLLKLTQCPYCLVRSPSRPHVLQHIKRQHPNEVRRVTVTSKTICSDIKKVNDCMSASGGRSLHVCSACQYQTAHTGRFRKHLVNCEKAKNFHAMMASSSESPSQASSLGDAEYALPRQESISDRSTKGLCDYANPSQVDVNAEYVSDADSDSPFPIFECSACRLTYKSNAELTEHIRENHYTSLQKAPGLSYRIRTPSPSSTKETNFLCDKCATPFKDRKSLQRHRTDFHFMDSDSITESFEETDDLMMRCPKCVNFGTRAMSAFKRHMLKHPGKHVTASKMCRLCQYMAQSREAILLHYSEKHCDITDPEMDNMKLVFYGERAACPVCDFTCPFQVEPLVNHMIKQHTGNHSALKQALDQLPDDTAEQSVEVGRKIDEKFLCKYCDAKFELLSTFLRHAQCHFSGEEQFIIFKCSCCHYQSDRKGLVSRHIKKKHAGEIRPPDYIRYVMLKSKLGSQNGSALERESSHRDRRVEELESSSHQGEDSPALFGEMEDEMMDTASDLYENPGFEPQDETDYMNVGTEEERGDTQDGIGGFLTPAMPEQYIKVEPMEEAETAVPGMTIERYHCDYCQFSSGIMEEFENHRCADPNSALEMPGVRDMQQATPAPEAYEASSSSDAADDDGIESYAVTSRKVGNEWECVECGYRSQHRNKIERHFRYKHQSKKPYICGYCNFSAVENGHVRRHCRNIHPGRPVSVVNSLKADQEEMYPDTPDDRNLPSDLDDQISQLGPYMFQCNICQYTSETHHLIERHVLCVHFKFHKYECKFCTYTAAEKGKIIKHGKLLHKGNVGYSMRKFDDKSKVPSKGASAALGSPRIEVASMPEQKFTPPAAVSLKRKSSSKSGLVSKKAKLDEDDEETVLKALTRLYTEVRANIIQTGESERYYRCTACTYTNDQKWCVVRHVSESHPESNDFDLVAERHRHTDQKKSSSCKICGQASVAYFDIKKHVLAVHFQYGIYNCKYCPSRLHSKFKMAEHVRTIHTSESQEIIEYPDPLNRVNNKMDKFCTPKKQSDGKYKCLFCPFARPRAKHVEQHLKKVHLNYINPFKCLYCGYSAKCKDSVRAHHYKWHINEYFSVVIVRAPGRSAMQSTPVESSPSSSRGNRLSSESSGISETTQAGTSKRKRESSESSSVSSTPKKLMKYVPGIEAEQLLQDEEVVSEKSVKVASLPKKPKLKSPFLKVKIGPKICSEKSEPVVNLRCQLCGKIMSGEMRLKTHLMMHLDYRPYTCMMPQCHGRFIEFSGVRRHSEAMHQKPEKYRYIPDEEMELKVYRLMSGDKVVDLPEKMKRCNPEPEIELETKVKLEPSLSSVEVESEPSVEENVKRIVHHVEGELGTPEAVEQHGLTSFKCPHCPQICKDRHNCMKHIRRHGPRTSKKRYKCCYCGYLGQFPSNVREHWKYKHEKSMKPFVFIKVNANNKTSEEQASLPDDCDNASHKKEARVEDQSPQRKEDAATKQYKPPSKPRNFALVKGPLGELYEGKRNKRTVFCCPHCDHQNESRTNCNRHIQLHGPKIFKCKYCDYICTQVPEVTKHCIRIHGRNGIVRLSVEKAIAMEEGQLIGSKESVVPESSSVESPRQKQDIASDEDSAKIAWIVQKLGWPRVHKSSKQGIGKKKKWRCPFCPFLDRVKTVVVRHMELHMDEKYSDHNRDNQGAHNVGSGSRESQLPAQGDDLYADVIKKLGKPRVYRSGASFSKRWKCPRCSFSLNTRCGILKHMTSHLDETTPRSGQERKSTTPQMSSNESLAHSSSSKQLTSDKTTHVQSADVPPIKKVRKRDGTVKYKCQLCPYESDISNNARMHNIRHGPKRFKCAHCDFSGFFASEISKHNVTHLNKPVACLNIETNDEAGVSVGAGTSVYSNAKGTAVSNAKGTAVSNAKGTAVSNAKGTAVSSAKGTAVSSAKGTAGPKIAKKRYLGELPVNKVTEGGRTVLKCPKCVYSTENNKYYRKHYRIRHMPSAGSSSVKVERMQTPEAQKQPDACEVRFHCDRMAGYGVPCSVTTNTLNEMRRHFYHRHRGRKLRYKIVGKEESKEDDKEEAATKVRRYDIPVPPLPGRDDQGVYHCSKCSFEATEKSPFQIHWKAHVRGYTCTICGSVQDYLSHMERHIKGAHKEMNYEQFVSDNAKDALKEMEAASTKEAPVKTEKQPAIQIERQAVYKCSKCTHTSFSELDHALHLSLHGSPKKNENSRKMAWTGWSPRPWECGYCSKGFFSYSKARSHWSYSHNELPVKIVQYDEKSGNRTLQNALRSPVSPRTRTNSDASGTSYGTNPSKGSNSDSNTGHTKLLPKPDAHVDSERGRSEDETLMDSLDSGAEKPAGVDTADSDDEGEELGCVKEENLWKWDEVDTQETDGVGDVDGKDEEGADEEEEGVDDEEAHADDDNDDEPDNNEGDGNEEVPDDSDAAEPDDDGEGGDDDGADDSDEEGPNDDVNDDEPDDNDAELRGYVDEGGPESKERADNEERSADDKDEYQADHDEEDVDDNSVVGAGDDVGEDGADNEEKGSDNEEEGSDNEEEGSDNDSEEGSGDLGNKANDTDDGAVLDENGLNAVDGIEDERTEAVNEVKVIDGFNEEGDSAFMKGDDVDEDYEGGWTIVSEDDESPLKCEKSVDNRETKPEKSGCSLKDLKCELDTDCADGGWELVGDVVENSNSDVVSGSQGEEASQLSREMNSSGQGSPGDPTAWMILDEVSDDEAATDMAECDIFS